MPNAVTLGLEVPREVVAGLVVGAGRLGAARDPDYFARVASAIRRERPETEFKWLGGHHPSPVADRLGRAGVGVTGWLPRRELLEELAQASVYLHTSEWDASPMIVLEAATLGVPMVARRIRPLDECPPEVLFDTLWSKITPSPGSTSITPSSCHQF